MESLKNLGLSYYESKILEITLLKKVTLKELSKKTKIPFGKIYSIVKEMIKKNLIEETSNRPKLIYVSNPQSIIQELIEQKQKKDQQVIQNARDILASLPKINHSEFKFFQIGTSREEILKIQLRTFIEADKEVCQIFNTFHKPSSNRKSKEVWEKEIVKSIKKGVKFKAIYPKNIDIPKKLKNISQGFKTKRINTEFTRCDIIDKKKVLVKFSSEDKSHPVGVLFIENEKLANNFQSKFDQLWLQAD